MPRRGRQRGEDHKGGAQGRHGLFVDQLSDGFIVIDRFGFAEVFELPIRLLADPLAALNQLGGFASGQPAQERERCWSLGLFCLLLTRCFACACAGWHLLLRRRTFDFYFDMVASMGLI